MLTTVHSESGFESGCPTQRPLAGPVSGGTWPRGSSCPSLPLCQARSGCPTPGQRRWAWPVSPAPARPLALASCHSGCSDTLTRSRRVNPSESPQAIIAQVTGRQLALPSLIKSPSQCSKSLYHDQWQGLPAIQVVGCTGVSC